MFSSRSSWDLQPNTLAAALSARRNAGRPYLDLTESNPTRAGFRYPRQEILTSLADERSLIYDPQPAGHLAARAAVAAVHGVSADQVVLTSGTSEAYAYLFKLLADPADEVLVPRPSYPLFEYLASLESVAVRPYPLVYQEGWQVDLAALRRRITARTRAILLVNPNNPTGSFLKRGELESLAAICHEHHLPLICDAVFSGFAFARDPERITSLPVTAAPLIFSLHGLSKLAGLPQLKCSWILLGGQEWQEAAGRLELIADTYLTVGTPVQHALPELLRLQEEIARQIQARLAENLSALRQAIAPDNPCHLLDVEGGWYVILQIPRTRSEEQWVLGLLERCDVLVHPGFFYDFEREAYLVLSLLTRPDVFREGARRVLAHVTQEVR